MQNRRCVKTNVCVRRRWRSSTNPCRSTYSPPTSVHCWWTVTEHATNRAGKGQCAKTYTSSPDVFKLPSPAVLSVSSCWFKTLHLTGGKTLHLGWPPQLYGYSLFQANNPELCAAYGEGPAVVGLPVRPQPPLGLRKRTRTTAPAALLPKPALVKLLAVKPTWNECLKLRLP